MMETRFLFETYGNTKPATLRNITEDFNPELFRSGSPSTRNCHAVPTNGKNERIVGKGQQVSAC
jgi:hypothetical protein